MDIIRKFLPYVAENQNQLHPTIKNSAELRLVRKYSTTVDELQKLKLATLGDAKIDKNGNVKVTQTPGVAALQSRITEQEETLERLVEIASEIGEILEQHKVESVHGLRETRAAHQNTIESHPFKAWDLFIQTRGKGAALPELMRVYWLPSDLCQVESYKAAEDKLRSEIEASRSALEPINTALARLDVLTAEADSI